VGTWRVEHHMHIGRWQFVLRPRRESNRPDEYRRRNAVEIRDERSGNRRSSGASTWSGDWTGNLPGLSAAQFQTTILNGGFVAFSTSGSFNVNPTVVPEPGTALGLFLNCASGS
jgi:hypothetical protein